MGVLINDATFDDRAPSWAEICAAITEISSLPVIVLETDSNAMHDSATIAFQCAPDNPLELQLGRRRTRSPRVTLRAYVGQESTLMTTTQLALEALGGRSDRPIDEEQRERCAWPITEDELAARQSKMDRQMGGLGCLTIVLLPVLIPLWIVWIGILAITTPLQIAWAFFRQRRAGR